MYGCFHCGTKSVVWDNDFSFEDMGYEGEGIVHVCHCTNCGCEIEYRVPDKSGVIYDVKVVEGADDKV